MRGMGRVSSERALSCLMRMGLGRSKRSVIGAIGVWFSPRVTFGVLKGYQPLVGLPKAGARLKAFTATSSPGTKLRFSHFLSPKL